LILLFFDAANFDTMQVPCVQERRLGCPFPAFRDIHAVKVQYLCTVHIHVLCASCSIVGMRYATGTGIGTYLHVHIHGLLSLDIQDASTRETHKKEENLAM
jgi:hypothetical protein